MIFKGMILQALPAPSGAAVGLVYDIKRKCCGHALVPPWGLVYDIKKNVPPGPPYPQVPPWGLVYDIKKNVFPPDPAYTFWCFGEETSVHLTHACG